jgi:hypothetical protein
MMAMQLPLEGGCLCGAVRYRISGAPHDAGYCRCRMCQRSTGAPVVAWLTIANERFASTEDSPTAYRSSADAERLFCPVCGTQLVFRMIAEPHHLDVTLASLDDPEAVRPGRHGWTASRIAWFDMRDDLPRHPGPRPDPAG